MTSRLAVAADVPALTVLMDAAIAELQCAFLDDAQIAFVAGTHKMDDGRSKVRNPRFPSSASPSQSKASDKP